MKGRANQWRLIMDLSASVNDRISLELCTCWMMQSPKWLRLPWSLTHENGYICQAYRNVPVAPKDKHLLGLNWNGIVYIDQVFPFGLRSAPLIFSALAYIFT